MSATPTSGPGAGRTPCGPPSDSWQGWYRLALIVAVFLVFSLQKLVQVRQVLRIPHVLTVENRGHMKQWLGCGVSLLFLALLLEFATVIGAKRVGRLLPLRIGRTSPPRPRPSTRLRAAFLLAAGLFFFAGFQGRSLSGYIATTPSPGPAVALAWLTAWMGFALLSLRRPPRWGVDLCGFVGLILVSRLYAYSHLPMTDISGDMLSTINRTLDLLFRGEFPYIDNPPPAMPYWPITLLQYAPPKLAGWDFRVVNLVVEVATVVAAFLFLTEKSLDHSDPITARLALPTAMLFPSWTFYSAETQYPVSVLLATLFCRGASCFGGRSQAVTLGVAVAANQTFGVLGLSLFPFWVRWFGPMRALRLTSMALATCLLIIGPFLLWDAREFIRVSLLSLEPFTVDQMAGTFSLRPPLDGLSPWAAPLLLALTFAGVVTVGFAGRWSKPDAAVVMTLGYCVALLLLHRSFSHYFLPVIAMVLATPYPARISRHGPKR